MLELNLIYRNVEKRSLLSRFLRRDRREEEIKNSLIIHENVVFSDMNNEAKVVEVVKKPFPYINIVELNKVPSGFIERRSFRYYPLQAEDIDKLLHPLCFLQNPVEINVDRDVVLARDHTVSRGNSIAVRQITVEGDRMVLHRVIERNEVLYEFFLEEKNGFYIVKEFTRNGVKFRIV